MFADLREGAPRFTNHSRWPALAAAAAGVGIVAAAVMASGTTYVGCLGDIGEPLTTLAEAQAGLETSSADRGCQLLALVVQQLLFIALALVAAGFFAPSRSLLLSLKPYDGPPAPLTAALLLLIAASAVYTAAVWLVSPGDVKRDIGVLAPLIRSDWWWLALLTIGIGAPLSEELLFRGFLMPALSRGRLGFAGASLLTTAAWTSLHASYSIFGIIEVFLIGLFFCWLLWRTGSLWVPIIFHAFYNIAIFLIVLLAPLPL